MRIVTIHDATAARAELEKIRCDVRGVALMEAKAVFKAVKVEGVATKAANLVKQTFLAAGAEAAVSRGTADLSLARTDLLLLATLKQYRTCIAKLKLQPWGLKRLAADLEALLAAEADGARREYVWKDRRLVLEPGRTAVMGILNVTPDSFSDGGKYHTYDAALKRLEEMVAEGADVIDIGAESTRPYPGAAKITAEEEIKRLLPLLERLLPRCPVPVSVDTYKAEVAAAALEAGAHIINDVWGFQYDPRMAAVAARYGAPAIIMHNQEGTAYAGDIMAHIAAFWRKSMDIALAAGVRRDRLIVDPGIGFGKDTPQNLEVLRRLEELTALGCPLLLAASRKRVIGDVLSLPVEDRAEGTAAVTALGILKGARLVRVHDVKMNKRVAMMMDAMVRSGEK